MKNFWLNKKRWKRIELKSSYGCSWILKDEVEGEVEDAVVSWGNWSKTFEKNDLTTNETIV